MSNTKPFEPSSDYTKVHNALFTLYTRLPDFNADHALMYVVLMSHYNNEYGCAFPTKADLALRLNCSINHPAKVAKVLEKYGLIRCVPRDPSKFASNDIYYVYPPITDEAEFYARFPEAIEYYTERERKLKERNRKRKGGEASDGAALSDGEANDIIALL
jgi:Helix-turn-helix domain